MDSTNQGGNAFPVDRPVEALIRDHNMVRTLLEAYRNSDSDAVKTNAAEQILMLAETHSLLEEKVFYPAVRNADPSLVGHFEEEHRKTDDLLARLKAMSLADPQAFPMFEQMTQMLMHHIEEEENQFFPKLENAGLDMRAIGLQMQAYEANTLHTQARASDTGAAP